jgi:tagatose 6-phosphate kinase
MLDSTPILCIGFTPALQRTMTFPQVELGEVNRAGSVTLSAAGKGVNVAHVLKTLGSHPLLFSFRGGDSGAAVSSGLSAWGVDCSWVDAEAPTRNCHTLVEDGGRRVTELVEEMACPSTAEWKQMDEAIDAAVPSASWLVISGKPPPGANPDCYARILEQAHAHRVQCVIDSQGEVLERALGRQPYLVKLNAEELAVTCGTARSDVSTGIIAIQKLGAQNVIVTQGPDCVWLADETGIHSFQPPAIEPLNPIGSGDAVTAGLLHQLQQGASLRDAVRYGTACGTANALTAEPGLLDPDKVKELLEQMRE